MAVAPVVTRGDDVGVSKVVSREAPVVGAQGAITVVEVAEIRGNARIISNTTSGGAPKVAAEAVQAGVELLKYHGLGFDFADLLGDDALGHLLKNKEPLLDDLDAFRMADDFLLLDNGDRTLTEVAVIEVIGAVEVVKTTKGADSVIIVERMRSTTSNELGGGRSGGGSRTGRKSGKSDKEDSSEFSGHYDD